jgi:hypothetical protein
MSTDVSNPISGISRLWTWLIENGTAPWVEPLSMVWELGKGCLGNIWQIGIYEVLNYESTLTLHDPKGKRATFSKVKKVRYLQDNIIAFQDYAWGDGEILLNYRTSRGKPVDSYRSGFKTNVLISLREVKNRKDEDEFNIQWNIRNGFLTKDGYWSTDVEQKTKHIKVNVIFPKSRQPQRIMLEESNNKRTRELGHDYLRQLPDGRWQVIWEMDKPKLYEIYVLRWLW